MQIYRVVLLIVAHFLLSVRGAPAADPIEVAAIFSITGIAASHNAPLVSLAQLAVSEINENGGVLGRPLELILLDNKSTTIGSIHAAEMAAQLGVAAVIGAHWSSHSLAVAPILQKNRIPMISPASTHPDVTRVGDFIFRVCFVDSVQGYTMARFALENSRLRRAVILRNMDETYSIALADYFKEAFVQGGGIVLLDRGYRGKAVDFSEIIEEMKTLRPDAVFLPGYTRDSGLIVKQAAAKGLKTTFLGGDAWDEIYAVAGESLAGSFQAAPWHPKVPFSKSLHLQRIYGNKFGGDIRNVSAPLAYDAVMLLADAITRAGSVDRGSIRDALSATVDFEGATGSISYGKDRNPEQKDIIILKYGRDGSKYHTTLAYRPDNPAMIQERTTGEGL